MKLIIRLFIVLIVAVGIALLADGRAAWAGPRVGDEPVSKNMVPNAPADGKRHPGSVKPPPGHVIIPVTGTTSVGGISTINVPCLADGYSLEAILWNSGFGMGRIPKNAGKPLAPITVVRVLHKGKFVSQLPEQDCQITICYALPPKTQGAIYFYDYYGPHFWRHGPREWVREDTTVVNGIAYAPIEASGAYALIGK